MKYLFTILMLSICLMTNALALKARNSLIINVALLQRLAPLKTSIEIEKKLGPPTACVPIGKQSDETAICQWKGNFNSNSIFNTLNITYEAGNIVLIRGISSQGLFYSIKDGKVVREE